MTNHGPTMLADALRDPSFYPHAVKKVDIRETHISLVALAGDFAYKIKKPLDLGFLDFTSLEKRLFYCRREVLLNRRLSRGIYLDVVSITDDGKYCLSGSGPVVEYAVKMCRLPDHAAMDRMLTTGKLDDAMVSALARRLARFYAETPRDEQTCAVGAWETVRDNCEENFTQLAPFAGSAIDRRTLEIISAATRAFLYRRRALFDRRIANGYHRDGHGDLRTDHVYFHSGEIQVIDCIEFNERFRCGDVAADLAFLAMDLDFIGFPDTAERFLSVYAAAAGDSDLYPLIDFYKCYRAMVRLKVNCLRLNQLAPDRRPPVEQAIRRHETLAYGYARRYSRPMLWVVCGMPATGKSTIAEALAAQLDVALVQSDAVRKQLFGHKGMQVRVQPFEAGIYSTQASGLTYGRLLLLAQEQLEQGRSVILDATFDRRRRRDEAARLARDMDAGLIFIECRCAEATIQHRLAARETQPGISDARLQHYAQFKARFEPLDELPAERYLAIDTDKSVEENISRILAAAERIGGV